MNRLTPIAGQWYGVRDGDQLFCIVNVDEDQRVLELQHFDGDLEAIEMVEWRLMDVEEIDEPEDWTGPLDDVDVDQLEDDEAVAPRRNWKDALEDIPDPT